MADDSKATDVGARYAQALFDLAVETNGLPAVEADLKAVTAMLAASADLRMLIKSPKFQDFLTLPAYARVLDTEIYTA